MVRSAIYPDHIRLYPEPDPEPRGWDDEGNLPDYPLDDGAVEYDEHTVPTEKEDQ